MIPKKIHYCWFGNSERPKVIQDIMKSWNKLQGFEIIEWNETNIDLKEHPYLEKSYNEGKYAFVSDYVRLKVLYEEGGIYLDTDVEVKKNFDDNVLNNRIFLSFMYNCNLSTAVIGAEKNNKTIKEILNLYDEIELNNSPNNDIYTNFMLERFDKFRLNNKLQTIEEGFKIYPKEYFEAASFTGKNYTVHHFTSTWKTKDIKREKIKKIFKIMVGSVVYDKIARYKALKISPFYDIYNKHKSEN